MHTFFSLIVLVTTTISTTDVCCRLYALRGEIQSVSILSVTNATAAVEPYCDIHDICSGFEVEGEPITCQEAFVLLTRHSSRPPLDTPPILMPYKDTHLEGNWNGSNRSRDVDEWGRISPEVQQNIVAMRAVVIDITERNGKMFPRIFYDDEIDGRLFRELKTFTDSLKRRIGNTNSQLIQTVARFIHRAHWMRFWSFYVESLMEYVATLSLVDMPIAIESIAPTMHAYMYLCTNLEIHYESSKDSYWLLTLLSRHDPLYIRNPADLVWIVPHQHDSLVEIQIGQDIDSTHFDDIVWGSDWEDLRPHLDNLEFVADSFIACIGELADVSRAIDDGQDLDEAFHEHVIDSHRLAYTLRYLGRETEHDPGPFDASSHRWLREIISAGIPSRFQIDRFTMTTLLRVTRSRLEPDLLWKFITPHNLEPPAYYGIQTLNISYLASGRPSMREIIVRISSVDPYRLSRAAHLPWHVMGAEKSLIELHADFLAAIFATRLFARNTTLTGHPFYATDLTTWEHDVRSYLAIHRTMGRLFGTCLRDPALRGLLTPYWITSSQPSTLLDTIFFGSFYIRKGVYDVLPYGVLEEMFPNANAMIDSLSRLSAHL
jgi:hypothetical protein